MYGIERESRIMLFLTWWRVLPVAHAPYFCLPVSSPAVQRGMEPGGGSLPADQLQPRELRQRPTLLQKPQREHRVTHHLQTGGLCDRGTGEAPATRHGKCVCNVNTVSNKVRYYPGCHRKPADLARSFQIWVSADGRERGSDFPSVEPVSRSEFRALWWLSPDQLGACARSVLRLIAALLLACVICVFRPFFIKLFPLCADYTVCFLTDAITTRQQCDAENLCNAALDKYANRHLT